MEGSLTAEHVGNWISCTTFNIASRKQETSPKTHLLQQPHLLHAQKRLRKVTAKNQWMEVVHQRKGGKSTPSKQPTSTEQTKKQPPETSAASPSINKKSETFWRS